LQGISICRKGNLDMARPLTYASQTLQDYGTPGSGSGAEKSSLKVWGATLTSGNIVAQLGLAAALWTAALDLTVGSQSATKVLAVSTDSAVVNTNPLAQRENKWLVRYHDTASTKFSVEVPTADLSLLDTGTEFLDLAGTEAAAFVTAFEAYAKSPDDPTLTVTLDSIQFVGRRN
jgi:hypothetical protein